MGLRPTVALVSRYGLLPAKPSSDTVGPIARTVTDAAIVLGAIAGYDRHDAVTAYSVGRVPDSYASFLRRDGLKDARIGVIREPMDPKADPASADYKQVRAVIDRAIGDLKAQGASLADPVVIPGLKDRLTKLYDGNEFETERALNDYLAALPNAPVKTLREILLSGKVAPFRAAQLMNSVNRSTDDAGYLPILQLAEETRRLVLEIMTDNRLDALVYATFDQQPGAIAADILSNPDPKDMAGLGNNRKLSPVLGFPAITVPAGFTAAGLPVGLEFLGRPFADGTLLKLGYSYVQATRRRKPPSTTPALPRKALVAPSNTRSNSAAPTSLFNFSNASSIDGGSAEFGANPQSGLSAIRSAPTDLLRSRRPQRRDLRDALQPLAAHVDHAHPYAQMLRQQSQIRHIARVLICEFQIQAIGLQRFEIRQQRLIIAAHVALPLVNAVAAMQVRLGLQAIHHAIDRLDRLGDLALRIPLPPQALVVRAFPGHQAAVAEVRQRRVVHLHDVDSRLHGRPRLRGQDLRQVIEQMPVGGIRVAAVIFVPVANRDQKRAGQRELRHACCIRS